MESGRQRWIAELTGARHVECAECIQSLWSGYGELFRVRLEGAKVPTAVVKWVAPRPRDAADRSHARKIRSYDVETHFYRAYAPRCGEDCRVAQLLGAGAAGEERLLVLEDLDAAGYAARHRDGAGRMGRRDLDACLRWLAAFHATFLGVAPEGLWPIGTYWHLDTRPDELTAIDARDAALRDAAALIDARLRGARFQTLVHGDAKVANFCFGADDGSSLRVAAVDFQYVGGGCGMKDVAYLLCGRWGDQSEAIEAACLDVYFAALRAHLRAPATSAPVGLPDVGAIEDEWRALYPIACADFYRFLAGWSKVEWARDRHGQRLVARVLGAL